MSSPSTITSPKLTPILNSIRPSRGTACITITHRVLDLSRAGHRAHYAGKFYQHAVARQLDEPALMRRDSAINNLSARRFERFERARFINTHHPTVTDHISG